MSFQLYTFIINECFLSKTIWKPMRYMYYNFNLYKCIRKGVLLTWLDL